jgi:hypothetical protein
MSAFQDQPVPLWIRHQLALEALARVLEAFGARGIDVLPVKGVILAHTLYANVTERPMQDLDLRIRPRDLRAAARSARERGWPVRRTSRQLGTIEFDVSSCLVEVETTIGPPGVCAIGVGEMLARSVERTEPLGLPHREPEIHDHALLLCVNAFKDKLPFALPWSLADLSRIGRLPTFDPETMCARARDARLTGMVWLVAEWVAREGGAATAWSNVLACLGGRPPRALYARMFNLLLQRGSPSSPLAALLVRACSDDVTMRAKAVALGLVGTAIASYHRAVLGKTAP